MTLYSANVLELATPVPKKGKKGAKAIEPAPAMEPTTSEAPAAKPKRVASEKQLAALAKGQETRKRKREEALAAKVAEEELIKSKEQEIASKEAELQKKVEERKEKRKAKALEKKQTETPAPTEPSVAGTDDSLVKEIEADLAPKPKRKRAVKSDEVPPKWFSQYVSGVKGEEARIADVKKPRKVVAQEARETAASSWNDGLTRNRGKVFLTC